MQITAWCCLLCVGYVMASLAVRTWRLEKSKRRKYLVRQAGLLALFYVGAMVMLIWLERLFIFHPAPFEADWQPPSTLKLEEVWFTTATGNRIHAFWCPLPGAKWTVLYSHGNAGHIGGRIPQIQAWQQYLGASVLIYDYPGFGRSTGTLDEAGCYAAGQVCYDWLRWDRQVPPEEIIIYGKSLGCAPATELAMRNPHRALMLMAPFTNIPDMAQELFPIFPVRWIARTRFDNDAKLARYQGVLLIGHGTEDVVVPFHHAERLDAVATHTRRKKFVAFPAYGHGAPPEEFFREAIRLLKETPQEAIPAAAG